MAAPEKRDETGRFLPGVSGNPGGRPHGLAAFIRDQTRDGEEMVEFMLAVMRDETGTDVRTRAQAVTWLSDRAFGRPVAAPESTHECEPQIDHEAAKEELRQSLYAISDRMRAQVDTVDGEADHDGSRSKDSDDEG